MFKALIILSLIQTGLLILLYSRTTALESELTALSLEALGTTASGSLLSPSVESSLDETRSSIDDARLRQIIREELSTITAIASNSGGRAPESVTYDAGTEAERQVQLDQVSQRIEYYSSVGSISEIEMGNLEMEIAKLDAAGRKAMLRKLTQALNSGAIDGRF